MTLACPTGAVPRTDELHKLEWVGVELIPTALATLLESKFPALLAAIGIQLLAVDDLCAQPVQIPPPFTDTDLLTALHDVSQLVWPPTHLLVTLATWIRYGAYQNFCQCNITGTEPSGTPCVPTTYHLTSSDFVSQPTFPEFANVGAWSWAPGGSTAPIGNPVQVWDVGADSAPSPFNVVVLTYPSGTNVFIPLTDQTAPFSFNVDMTARLAAGDTNYALFIQAHASAFPEVVPTTLDLTIHTFSDATHTCTAVQPPDAPAPDVTAPAMPAQDCSNLCAVNWNTLSLVQNNTSTVIDIHENVAPTAYALGASTTVSGIGEITVSGIIGALVTVTTFAAGSGVVEGDPEFFPNFGWITFGNADGWQKSVKIVHVPEVFLSDLQSITRIGYNTEMATSVVVQELVPVT